MMVEFRSNGSMTNGYLAVPATGSGPGVIVLQEWWGLVDHIKQVCERLATAGFTALAPDMYHGECTTDPDEAGLKMMALEVPKVAADLRGATAYMLANDAVSSERLGIMGFCLGGQLALFGACENPTAIGACVNFYGVHPNITPDVTRLAAPVLGHFAEKDGFVTAEVVTALSKSLSDAGKHHEFKIYPGVDHAFFNDSRPDVYDADAAADAWEKTVEFLRGHVA